MKQTILQRGIDGADLFVYAHIAPDIISKHVAETTADAVVVELWGNGTAAYRPVVSSYGGTKKWIADLAAKCGKASWPHWALTCWSAGGQVAKEVCLGPAEDQPDAIVLLDAVYGSKPAGARPGDGKVIFDQGLQALARYALSAARGERTMVLLHSRIRTPYASSKECCEAIQRWVEEQIGERLGPDTTVTAEQLDQHGFIEALGYGNLHVIEFAGLDAKEHIAEAHLYDEVWKLWIPWTSPAVEAADTVPPEPMPASGGPLVLKIGASGPAVARWQQFLVGQHLLSGVVDGRFGPKTEKATEAFQEARGLAADGIVGARTLIVARALGLEDAADPKRPAVGEDFPPEPDFLPLVGTAARQRVFGAFRYEPAPVDGNPEAIRVLDDWVEKNIVLVHVPQLIGVSGAPKDGRVQFHKLGAEQLRRLFEEWERAGMLDMILTWGGSYAPRFIRGSRTTLSNHAAGSAFDINVRWNGLGVRPAEVDTIGSVRRLVPVANDLGWWWGGHFKSRPDGMHLELAELR